MLLSKSRSPYNGLQALPDVTADFSTYSVVPCSALGIRALLPFPGHALSQLEPDIFSV